MKRVLLGLFIIIGGLIALYTFGSGVVAEKAASKYLDDEGIAYRDLSISSASLNGAGINRVILGAKDNITLEGADIRYTVRGEAFDVRGFTARRITLDTATANGTWDLGGLETKLGLAPFDATDAPRIRISGTLASEKGEHGLQASLTDATVTYALPDTLISAMLTKVSLIPTANKGEFAITLEAKSITVKRGEEQMISPLALSATGMLAGELFTGQGKLSDDHDKLPLILSGHYNGDENKGSVQWTSGKVTFVPDGLQPKVLSPLLDAFPALDATLNIQGDIRFDAKSPPRLRQNFIIDRAALSPLLKLVFKDDIAVTGDLKGTIPVRWSGEKIAQIRGAKLENTAPGTLIYDPLTGADALEGQDQAGLLLEALRKFNYDSLTVTANSDTKGKLLATFNIKGSNPEFFKGQPVDFTLNVNGDLLSLLESQAKIDDIIRNQ